MSHMMSNETVERLLLSLKEAADALGISSRTLCNLTKSGQVDFVRVGRTTRYSVEHLKEFIERSKNKPKPA